MHYGDYSSTASRSQQSRIQYIGPASSFFACLLTAAAALSLFSFGGRAPHPEGTWPKTLLHKPMGVASTEGGGLARRPSSEIDRLAAKGRGICDVESIFLSCCCCDDDLYRGGWNLPKVESLESILWAHR